jgi:carboxypeptidase D
MYSFLLIVHRNHLCGLDLNLTYPQSGGKFPTLNLAVEPGFGISRFQSNMQRRLKTNILAESLKAGLFARREEHDVDEHTLRRLAKRDAWKRDLSGRANGTIDPWYGCDLYDELIEYALNFSIPWSMWQYLFIFTLELKVVLSRREPHL